MTQHAEELIPTRATLIRRLRDWKDDASWQEFVDTYWNLICGVARKAGLTSADAEDIAQETLFSAAKHLSTFRYDPSVGSFKAWLLNMTRWRIIDHVRKRDQLPTHHDHPPGDITTGTRTVDRVVDPAGQALDEFWEREWETALLEAALNRVKRHIDPVKFQIFDLYVHQAWPPDKVAASLDIPVDQVYLAKHRITALIKKEVSRLEKEIT